MIYTHAMQESVAAAKSLSVHPVYHQFILGHVKCLKKLHHEMFI